MKDALQTWKLHNIHGEMDVCEPIFSRNLRQLVGWNHSPRAPLFRGVPAGCDIWLWYGVFWYLYLPKKNKTAGELLACGESVFHYFIACKKTHKNANAFLICWQQSAMTGNANENACGRHAWMHTPGVYRYNLGFRHPMDSDMVSTHSLGFERVKIQSKCVPFCPYDVGSEVSRCWEIHPCEMASQPCFASRCVTYILSWRFGRHVHNNVWNLKPTIERQFNFMQHEDLFGFTILSPSDVIVSHTTLTRECACQAHSGASSSAPPVHAAQFGAVAHVSRVLNPRVYV